MQSTIIIGGGPGGMGPLVWAAQSGKLAQWLKQGVSLIDRQNSLGGTLGRYAINSDSLGSVYLECLEAPQAIEALCVLRQDPVVREMEQYRSGFPPLELVDRFMRRIGDALAQVITAYPDCSIQCRTKAEALYLRRDGTLRVDTLNADGSRSSLITRTAVMALGGSQQWGRHIWQELRPGLRLADCRLRHLIPSDRLLTSAGLVEIRQVLAEAGHRKIVILGGSHSAYSAAWALTRLADTAGLGAGQILLLPRRPPPVFYPDTAAADADGYIVRAGDICPRTNRVHRLGGLRGNGRDIWRQISGRPDTRPDPRIATAMLSDMECDTLRQVLEDAAVVIPAFGYSAAVLPVYSHHGRRLALRADQGLPAVDHAGRLLLANGTALPHVFSLGLGSGYRPEGTMGGEPNFRSQANSLWLYQNDIGAMIYHGVQMALHMQWPLPRGHKVSVPAMAKLAPI